MSHNVLYQGVALGLASLNRLHDQPTLVCDTLRGLGLTFEDLHAAGCEAYDLNEIRKCLRQGGPADREQVERKKEKAV